MVVTPGKYFWEFNCIRRSIRTVRVTPATITLLAGILALFADLVGQSVASVLQTPSKPGFVTRLGTHFAIDGKPFFVAGVNNHYLTFGSAAEVERVLDDAVAMGASVVRTFIQPVIGSPDGVSRPTIWDFQKQAQSSDLGVHGNYLIYWDPSRNAMALNEGPRGMEKLDFLVKEAGKRNLKLIIAFLDFWDYTGGAQQMRAWYGSQDMYTFFFQDDRTKNDFKNLVQRVLLRTNSFTGVAYKEDPTIFAWDLMNEPNIEPRRLLNEWISEMSSFVKMLDPNHLVTSGHANIDNHLSDIRIPAIDFATWHGYPIYNNRTVGQMDELIKEYCDLAASYEKPVLLEEFGYARSNPDQIAAYRRWLDTIDLHPDCAGWLVWRLVSFQDDLSFPKDDYDQFDVHNDGGPLWSLLREAASKLSVKAERLTGKAR